jgi:hypothetical protein
MKLNNLCLYGKRAFIITHLIELREEVNSRICKRINEATLY